MKKLLVLILSIYMSVSLSACTPADENSLPTVDIVSRSDLVDRININYIINRQYANRLEKQGLDVDFDDFELSGDNAATFDLVLKNAEGKQLTLPVESLIRYEKSTTEDGKDMFRDVSLYWGNIQIVDGTVLITNLDRVLAFSLEEMNKPNIEMSLEFAEGEAGYIAAATKRADGYAALYWADSEEGIAVFDIQGDLIRKSPFRRWQRNYEGDYLSYFIDYNYGDLSQQTVPYIFKDTSLSTAAGRDDVFLIDDGVMENNVKMLYNSTLDALYSGGYSYTRLADGPDTYSVYSYMKTSYYYGTIRDDYTYLAVRETDGAVADTVYFEEDDCRSMSKFGYSLSKGETDSQLIYTVEPTGMTLTIDFDSKTVDKQFAITDDMLKEKLAVSKDKRHSLYSYAYKGYGNIQGYHVVLKDNKTGDIKYLDEIGISQNYTVGKTGFFSNGDVYILNDDDFKIYTTDMNTDGAEFRLGDNFPLGICEDENGSQLARYICAARRDPDDGSFIAVYYQHPYPYPHDRGMDGWADGQFIDATYQVALLDSDGNMTASYDTGVQVPDGIFEINMYLKGDILTLEMTYKDFDEILWKGTLDITNGQFKETKPFSMPTQF